MSAADLPAGGHDHAAEAYRIAACEGKDVFGTWLSARRTARRMSRRAHERGTGERFEAYRCRRCKRLHVGGLDQLEIKRQRARRRRRKRSTER